MVELVDAPEMSGVPDRDDLVNFALASAVTAVAFSAFYQEFNASVAGFYLGAGALILATRELGIRSAIYILDGYVDLEISSEGATFSVLGAILAVVSGLPIIFLFPIYSSASRKKYEQWGKSTDVIWALYKFKVAKWGILALITGFIISFSMGMTQLAQMYAVFTFFQMLPFDYSGIPSGPLDGAEIIRWSGAYWLFFTGISLFFLAITL